MSRILGHWIPLNALALGVLDIVFLLVAIVSASFMLDRVGQSESELVALSALVFAGSMVAINGSLGLYSSCGRRRLSRSIAIAALSLIVSVPVAYLVFTFSPLTKEGTEATRNVAILALMALLAMDAMLLRSAVKRLIMPSVFLLLLTIPAAYSVIGAVAQEHRHLESVQILTWSTLALITVMRGYVISASFGRLRVLVFGAGPESLAVKQCLQSRTDSIEIVGFYPSEADDEPSIPRSEIIGTRGSLVEVVRSHRVDEVVVALRDRRGGALPLEDLLACKLAGVKVLDLSSYFERTLGQLRLDSLRASWLIFADGFRQGSLRSAAKRAFDIIGSVVLLAMASPLMVIAAVAIVLETGFPVFYRQERVGRGGCTFNVIKFRSMRADAERDGTPRWAGAHDSRVTCVGRIIRKFRIDELPQIFNVLKGEMSLVGPRPERPYFVEQLTRSVPFYAARHSVKPGLTGWAQVRYHYGASVDDACQKLQYDLYYVKNHSLVLDAIVLCETVRVVLFGEGAQ